MDDKMRIITTDEELKIFSDPYRMKIIKTYQGYGVPLTVKQCADHLGEVPAKVHYHVKKLLSINVLELDHVEVINGINAKYYYLPKTSFTVKLQDEESEKIYKQLNKVESMIANMIDDFKKDFFISSKNAVDHKIEDPTEVGMITAKDVYLSEEDFEVLSKELSELANRYSTIDKEKKRYSLLAGFARKE